MVGVDHFVLYVSESLCRMLFFGLSQALGRKFGSTLASYSGSVGSYSGSVES